MKTIFPGFLMVLAVIIPLSVASAQDIAPAASARMTKFFVKADANGDGKVTFDELKVVAPKMTEVRFNKLDKNQDGVLTPNEMPKPGAALVRVLKKADTNGDGKVTFEELKAVMPKMTQERFNTLDKNQDGVISRADRPAKVDVGKDTKVAAESVATGVTGEAVGSGKGVGFKARFEKADVNKDGKLTWEEAQVGFPRMRQERFQQLDVNKDGFLTADEASVGRSSKS